MSGPCRHWDVAELRRCGATPTRLYPQGDRCASHTPAAVAGLPEPPENTVCAPARLYCPPGRQCPTCATHQPRPIVDLDTILGEAVARG